MIGDKMNIKRGDILVCSLSGVGSVQGGARPCLVISNNKANRYSPVITVLPITSRKKKLLPTHVPITLEVESYIMAEQIISIDKKQVNGYYSDCDNATMEMVEAAMMIQLDISDKSDYDNERILLNKLNEYHQSLCDIKRQLDEEKEKIKVLTANHSKSY